jgi:hypothetical protein
MPPWRIIMLPCLMGHGTWGQSMYGIEKMLGKGTG